MSDQPQRPTPGPGDATPAEDAPDPREVAPSPDAADHAVEEDAQPDKPSGDG